MPLSVFRRPVVAVTALAALIAAALIQAPTAGAAIADSTVVLVDPANDTTPSAEPKADITAASVRYQNDHITFVMKLAKGDDLSTTGDTMFWSVGAQENASPDFVVDFKRGANGFGQAVISEPGGDPIDCIGTAASFDVATGTYIATVPSKCVGSPAPFNWNAVRRVTSPSGSTNVISDFAPDTGVAKAVSPSPVSGYWAIGSDGKVYGFGDATKTGEPSTPSLNTVDIESSPHGTGYWTLDDRGAVNGYGPFVYGNVTDLKAGERAVSMSSTPSGAGYWVFTNKGRAIGFGDADKNIGDVSKITLNAEVLDSAAMPSGKGYYLVAADGGVFALGDAKFEGSMGDTKLNQPVQSIVPDPDGQGYWLVAADGGVFAFKAVFLGSTGSIKLNKPMTGMVPFGNGYLMVAQDGGVFNYSNRPFSGSLGNNPPTNPIVSIAALS